jgi:hypothetical protein
MFFRQINEHTDLPSNYRDLGKICLLTRNNFGVLSQQTLGTIWLFVP